MKKLLFILLYADWNRALNQFAIMFEGRLRA